MLYALCTRIVLSRLTSELNECSRVLLINAPAPSRHWQALQESQANWTCLLVGLPHRRLIVVSRKFRLLKDACLFSRVIFLCRARCRLSEYQINKFRWWIKKSLFTFKISLKRAFKTRVSSLTSSTIVSCATVSMLAQANTSTENKWIRFNCVWPSWRWTC